MLYKGEIPFVRLLVPLIAGISLGYYCSGERLFTSVGYITLISVGLFALFIWYYKSLSLFKCKWIAGALSHIFLGALGCWLTIQGSESYEKKHYSLTKSDAFVVVIITEPKTTGKITRFEARIKECILGEQRHLSTGKILISIYSETSNPKFKYGDLLLLPARFENVEPPYNPGEFNYKLYLANHQIYFQTFLPVDQTLIIAKGQGNQLISYALNLRKHLVDKFSFYLPGEDAGAFASSLILGYRAELSKELLEAYSKTGTMHVLSVSGMHVGIIYIVLSVLLKFMNKTQAWRVCRGLVMISVIWFYALLTGFSAPACRAAVMLSFIVLGKALNKQQNTYNLIAISAFFLLLYNPFYLVDAGFQLSYLAVTGLVYFHPKFYQALYVKNRFLDYIWSYTALSIAAQLATFPFSIYYFHQFPVYFLLSNLILVLPVAVIMYAGILFLLIPYPSILYPSGELLSFTINATNNILYYIENLPYSSWEGLWINMLECILICLLILFICLRLSFGFKMINLPITVLTILLFSSLSWNSVKDFRQDKIVFYNVRKNSVISYTSKNRSVIVSDINMSDKLMGYSIFPAVKKIGSSDETFFDQNSVFSGRTYWGDENFYQFGGCKIMRWDKNFDNLEFARSLSVEYVLLSGNPRVTIEKISSFLNFSKVVIEANNPDYKIAGWVAEARKMHLPYYVLKKNPALIVKL